MKNRTMAFRITLIACGALAMLAFFLIPLMHRPKTEVENGLDQLANMLGFSEELEENKDLYNRENITTFRLVASAVSGSYANMYPASGDNEGLRELKYFLGQDDDFFEPSNGDEEVKSNYSAFWQTLKYGLPVIFAVALIVFGAIGGMVGGIGSISSAVLMLTFYLIQLLAWPKWKSDLYHNWEYSRSPFYFFVLIIPVAAIVLGVFELLSARKAKAQAMDYSADNMGQGDYADPYGYNNGGFDQGGGGYQNGGQGCLIGVRGEYEGATIPIPDGARIAIGRSSNDCHLVLQNQAVSRTHCYINYYADRNLYSVMDISKFGVFDTEGNPIEKNTMVYMAPGDEIHIGRSNNVFRFG